nr:hypothetical protein [Streptomyces sp. 846.5]
MDAHVPLKVGQGGRRIMMTGVQSCLEAHLGLPVEPLVEVGEARLHQVGGGDAGSNCPILQGELRRSLLERVPTSQDIGHDRFGGPGCELQDDAFPQ